MIDSNSQNASAWSYGDSVEVGSFTVLSYDSVIHDVETYSDEPVEPSQPADHTSNDQPDNDIVEAESRPVTEQLVTEVGTSGRGKPPRAALVNIDWLTDLPADSTPLASTGRIFLSSEGLRQHISLLTRSEIEEASTLLTGQVKYNTRWSLKNIIDWTHGDWLGVHLDSLKAPLTFPFHPFLLGFMKYYGVLPRQISPNRHRILACFPQICGRHGLPVTMELFRYIFSIRPISPKHGGGVLCV